MCKDQTNQFISIFIGLSVFLFAGCGDGREKIEASGTIEAPLVTVSARVGGEIASIGVDEGTRITKGDRLARISNTSIELSLRQAEKNVALAETQLVLVTRGARIEDIEQVEAALVQAENSYKIAEEDFRRMQALFATGSVTQKQRDDAEARAAIARAQYNSAQQALNKIKNLAQPEEVEAAMLRRDCAKIAVELVKEELAHTEIKAPLDGIVTHKLIEEGELVFPGSALFTISDLSAVRLMIYVTERELAHVFIGQKADISIDAFPDKTFPGEVTYISPRAEFTPKNVQSKEDRVKLVFGVKIKIENSDERLKPGMPADAVIKINGEKDR